ncbi:alpha/beta fold hydrolase [Salinisphaera sp. Q1T1-3]|uniref:alpha/beta fold hydrolase n=1 Tax=Salinisphaera sp. Q1T1-3 TaxID=2321229 RepID=UPI0018F72B7E|nr:alpha/beta fold hydrolase [Salinisphaera sp. Q1T1-3]
MPDSEPNRIRTEREPDALIDTGHVTLACYTDGDPGHPRVVMVHGYPDTAGVWDRLTHELSGDYYCIRYDVRGAGRSSRPRATRAYRLSHLRDDLATVLDWACPDGRAVHLIGHDWGSIGSWEAVTDTALSRRIASYTSLSGPCLDHVGHGLRRRWTDERARVMRQLRRSWYIGLFQVPGLGALGWRHFIAPRWPALRASRCRSPPPGCRTAPTASSSIAPMYCPDSVARGTARHTCRCS